MLRPRRVTALTVPTLFVITVAHAQTTQPTPMNEWFVGTETRIAKDDRASGGFEPAIRYYDPTTGEERKPDNAAGLSSSIKLNSTLLRSDGQCPVMLRKVGNYARGEGHIALVSAAAGAPVHAFSGRTVKSMHPMSLSPNGKNLVHYDYNNRELVIDGGSGLHVIRTTWWITRPFSWSPDGDKVAFYYALDGLGDDDHVQQHGVAVLSLTGELREVVKASESFGTSRAMSKYFPPGWGKDSESIYFTMGLAPDDLRRNQDNVKVLHPPARTCRVTVRTGEITDIALGEFSCVSPDEKYVLLYPSPVPTDGTGWSRGTTMIDLASHQVRYLPATIRMPKISLSGDLVAAVCDGIAFYRTSDWSAYGKPVRQGQPMSPEDWGMYYRWITVPSDFKGSTVYAAE